MNGFTNKKVKFGVISASGMAKSHMRSIKMDRNTELIAVCDIDAEKAKKAAEELEIPYHYKDYREMLVRDDIDAVVVCTPDQTHEELTTAALEAGKHVLCEKPMALTVGECRRMIASSKRTGKKLMIGQICRYTPGFKLAKKMIDDGQIGELFFVESEYAHDYADISGVNNWRKDPVKLRHPFIGGACHAVDLLRWITGNPYEVMAYASRKVLKSWPVDDCTIAIMRFPNGVLGKVFLSIGCKRAYTMRSVFYGDKGTIIADNRSPFITVYKESIAGDRQLFEGVPEENIGIVHPVVIESHNTVEEIMEFAEIILKDREVLTDGIQGASTVAACCAAVEAASKGEKVEIKYDFC